jgi:hypothetical protein
MTAIRSWKLLVLSSGHGMSGYRLFRTAATRAAFSQSAGVTSRATGSRLRFLGVRCAALAAGLPVSACSPAIGDCCASAAGALGCFGPAALREAGRALLAAVGAPRTRGALRAAPFSFSASWPGRRAAACTRLISTSATR